MLVVNMNTYPVSVKIIAPYGIDFIHLMGRGRANLPEGTQVDSNWLVSNPQVKLIQPNASPQVVSQTTPSDIPKVD